MPSIQRVTALAIARALLAGPQEPGGLAARVRLCLGTGACDWHGELAARIAKLSALHWQYLTPRALARLVEIDPGYQHAWISDERPTAHRWILREAQGPRPAPLGLERIQRPAWPHAGALAAFLGMPIEGLWRLTLPADRQRRRPLAEQHYRCRLLAKRSGGMRLLEVPEPHLMAVQRRLLDALLDFVPPHEAAFGHARGRSVVDHAAAHAGQAVVLKFDLRDFYSSVRASRVHALFATLGYSDEVARALTALTTVATPEAVLRRLREAGSLTWEQLQRLRDPHLPQGAPTSAALANLCAFGLDLRLDGLAYALGARYTRYADDLVLSGGPELARWRDRIERWVGRIAREEGFALNHRKTRCQRSGARQTVCSIVVNAKPNLPRAEFDRLKAILHRCVVDGPAAQNRDGIERWREHLAGRIAWAAQLNAAKAARLQSLFARIDWER